MTVYDALALEPLDFQTATLNAYRAGKSGLIQVPTGSGKTLAAIAGPLERLVGASSTSGVPAGLHVLFVTPLRALSRDTERAVTEAVVALGAPVTVECRTGDVSSSRRARQLEALPNVLITTPESLSVLLSRPGCSKTFADLDTVVIDEWHELISTKRGTQTELALARLRALRPGLQTWALSATLGNPEEAARAACGVAPPVIITSTIRRPIELELVAPPEQQGLPWSGHLGLTMVEKLLARLDPEVPTLIFTNTRKQAERWYQRLLELRPEHGHRIALHHGSIARELRRRIESEARAGRVTWTVATSSLDLGIDFAPVDIVVQVGSPKSLARLIQRAGRSAHRPGRTARVLFVPTHSLELLEYAAAKESLPAPKLEARRPLEKPLDVLAQHLVTMACGDGFRESEVRRELANTASYASVTEEELQWVIRFVSSGGESLSAYDHYRKLERRDGVWRVRSAAIARTHRMSIGTIDGNSHVRVVFTNRKPLGTIEEQFVGKLKKGDTFHFAGRMLKFVMMRDTTVYVRATAKTSRVTPSWPGGSLPLSESLGDALRALLDRVAGKDNHSEMDRLPPPIPEVVKAQRLTSALPRHSEVLVELFAQRGAAHLFVYPFAGRPVHEGIAALAATRLQRTVSGSIAVTTNDYGFHLEASAEYPFEDLLHELDVFAVQGLASDLADGVNLDELARRAFRGVARVSGLVFPGYPGAPRPVRQLQASAHLLYEVFAEHEPDNLLLAEARREVMRTSLDADRIGEVMQRLATSEIRVCRIDKPSPLAFPLLIEQLTQRRSSLGFEERVEHLRRKYALA